MSFIDLAALDKHLETATYIGGVEPTQQDISSYQSIAAPGPEYPHAARWYNHIATFTKTRIAGLPAGKASDSSDSFNCQPCAPSSGEPSSASAGATRSAGGLELALGLGPGECCNSYPEWHAVTPTTQRVTGLKVLNSLTGEKVPFIPREGNKVLWYTCGPTVYDVCHIGHARAYLTMDIMRRIMEDYFGYEVFLQVNVTDIDDKIIQKARRNKLVDDYEKAAKPLATVKDEVKAAVDVHEAKMAKKLEELHVAKSDKREEEERKELLKQHQAKVKNFDETKAKVEQLMGANASAAEIIATAKDSLGESLDAQFGATVTQHEVFNAHSRRYEKEFIDDLDSLGIRMPDALSRVTEYVPQIVDFVKAIIDKGMAYESNGSVYMDIGKFKAAGHDYPKVRGPARPPILLQDPCACTCTRTCTPPGSMRMHVHTHMHSSRIHAHARAHAHALLPDPCACAPLRPATPPPCHPATPPPCHPSPPPLHPSTLPPSPLHTSTPPHPAHNIDITQHT